MPSKTQKKGEKRNLRKQLIELLKELHLPMFRVPRRICQGKDLNKPLLKAGGIVFSSNRSGPWRIWLINTDGSIMRQLTEGKPDEHDVDPAFSPDGKTILFTSDRGGKIGIWKMPIDGAGSPEPNRFYKERILIRS